MDTLFVGRNNIFLPEVNSTNSYAIMLLKNVKDNVMEGTVVHAAHQTSGRGQRGNDWNAEPASNLTASVILKPVFLELKHQFFLYQVAALACYDVMAEMLNSSQYDIKIKWPNDILIDGKKAAGILIENVVFNNVINWSVIGIGINVNQVDFSNGVKASSLKLISGGDYEVKDVLDLLCEKLEKYYLLLKNKKPGLILENYLQRFFSLNRQHHFEIGGETVTMLVKGISDTGLLLLEDEAGRKKEFDLKEVKWKM